MENNIVKIGDVTAILNGGNPLPGCPESWEQAREIETNFNKDKEEYSEPLWKFDCGFKLDFDGPIIRVNSRFYPPKTHYGATWDGNVSIMIGDKTIKRKEFDCQTLDELRNQVEAYVKTITDKLRDISFAE